MKTINMLIRIAQLFFVVTGLNNAYGLFIHLGLSAAFGSAKLGLSTIIGAVATVVICGLSIFLLQRYYEQRNNPASLITPKKFLGIALSGVGVAAAVGIGVAIMIAVFAFANL